MVVAQIDGLSGTGKSTLCIELMNRGYCAVDSDSMFAYFGDLVTGQPAEIKTRSHWVWDVNKLRDYCARLHEWPVFICGGAMNQGECADMFSHRFLLCIDNDTMRHRLLTRKTHDFGKDPHELAEQLELNRGAEAEGRRAGWVIVDATQPIAEVADEIIHLATTARADRDP